MKRITWLASYPKSGNTWLRVFLTNLRRDAATPADINRLDAGCVPHAAYRALFDSLVGYETEDLTHDEVDRLRLRLYLHQAAQAKQSFFCKVHDAYTFLADGRPLFPPQASAGAIYLIRNPLDVCVSYAHFLARPRFDWTIAAMADSRYTLCGGDDAPDEQLRQRLLSWSGHVLSWVDAPHLRILVVRYEDMKARPVKTFTAVAAFMGMTQDRAKITRAMEFSSLEELQRQERARGFKEQHSKESPFFRKGKAGGWREELTETQAASIIRDHGDVMLRFGYLTEEGEPVLDFAEQQFEFAGKAKQHPEQAIAV